MNKYEIMFLFDPTFAADGDKVREEIERILGRAEAKITFLEKWDERRLAYEIKGRRRGTYFLVYFECEGEKITGIERDARLSETVLRILVKRADNITPAVIERFMPSSRATATDSKPSDAPAKPAATSSSSDGSEEEASAEEKSSAVAVAESDDE